MRSPPIALSLPFGAVPAVSTFEAPAQSCYIEKMRIKARMNSIVSSITFLLVRKSRIPGTIFKISSVFERTKLRCFDVSLC